MKEFLFSVTKDDFEIQTFRSGGKGGQNQNKRDSGVRLIHKESGAVGESREERSQLANKKKAFNKLIETDTFKKWLKIKSSQYSSIDRDIMKKVEDSMKEENLKIEYLNDKK